MFVFFLDTTLSQPEHNYAQKKNIKHQLSFVCFFLDTTLSQLERKKGTLSTNSHLVRPSRGGTRLCFLSLTKKTEKGEKWVVELASAHSDAMQMCFYPQRLRGGLCGTLTALCSQGSSKLRCTRSLCVADTHLSQLA